MRMPLAALLVVLLLAGCTAAPEPQAAPVPRPAPTPVDPILEYADDRLSVMTLDQKIASMLMIHVPGVDPAALGAVAAGYGVGGLILMRDNVPDDEASLAGMTPTMKGEAGLPVLVAIDQEGGVVRRLFTDDYPAALDLRFAAPDASRAAFGDRAALLAALGISVNFGIVADVTADPASFIYDRSLGGSAVDAAARVGEAVRGESGSVLSTLKHFPGHGVAPGDSHSSVPSTAMGLDEWREGHGSPFAAGVEAGAELVMFGHLRFDSVDGLPATLSPAWHTLLRDELGFDGIAITDDMVMLERSDEAAYANQLQNAVSAVAAGNTMLLYVGPVDIPGVVGAVRDAVVAGTIPASTIDDAAHRLLVLRRTLSGQTGNFVHCFEQCQSIIE